MQTEELTKQLARAEATVRTLQQELAETNRGLVALTMELEQRVDERTAELRAAHGELLKTNSELMQLTLELENRVDERTAKLRQAIEDLEIQTTKRQRAEEKVRQPNAQLEQRVRDRTAQLEAANRELEAFSDSISHDLRAPLRHIGGFADLLGKAAGPRLPGKSLHYLEEILVSAKQMGCLIDDLLLFSRMVRAEMKLEPVNLERLVNEAKKQLDPESKGRDIRWKQNALLEVRGDGALLRQVMLNLLSNALKYTRPRKPAEIEIGCDGSSPQETVVFVRDNGVGFDMAYADKLFRVFQRLHSDEEFEGTGIGLASVRRIIARHGGRTWAEGKPNAGATFYFSLPKIPFAP
jgi:signal transduction histidine kinase